MTETVPDWMREQFEAGHVPMDEPPGFEERYYKQWLAEGGQVRKAKATTPRPSSDGGPAFPIPWGCDKSGMHLPADPKGMSLRDWFAGLALQGILAFAPGEVRQLKPAEAAEEAREYADALLKELGKA